MSKIKSKSSMSKTGLENFNSFLESNIQISTIEEFGTELVKLLQDFAPINMTILFYDQDYDFLPDSPVFRYVGGKESSEEFYKRVYDEEMENIRTRFKISESGIFTDLLIRGKSVFIQDIEKTELNEIEMQMFNKADVGTLYFEPLKFKQEVFGYILFWKLKPQGKFKVNTELTELLKKYNDKYIQIIYTIYVKSYLNITRSRFRQFFTNSQDLIILMKADGAIIEANKHLDSILGYSISEVQGQNINNFIYKEDQNNKFPNTSKEFEYVRFYDSENNVKLLEISSFTHVEFGDTDLFYWICRNQEERQLFLNRMIQSEKTKSLATLAGGIAHDFNNYLAAIEANTSLLQYGLGELVNDDLTEIINNIHQVVNHSQRLTQQLLTFSTGGNLNKKPIEVEKLVTEAVDFSLTGTDIVSTINSSIENPYILADKGMLIQVFTNLIINSRDAMDGEKEKKIRIEIDKSVDDNIIIELVDNGKGIDESEIDRIFDPFFTNKTKGTGLGLSTSKSIIREHDGDIFVESVPSKYTKFTVKLPIYHGIIDEEQAEFSEDEIKGEYLIWIMDDVDAILLSMEKLLTHKNQKVVTFREGNSLLLKLKSKADVPDLMILDLTNRLGMGGIELFNELFSQSLEIPIILMSGYAENFADFQTEKNSFLFLRKPIFENDLIGKINQLMESKG